MTFFFGLFAQTGAAGHPGDASVIYRSGTIDVQGSNSVGIFAGAQGNGSAEITTLPGTTIIVRGNKPGDPPTRPGNHCRNIWHRGGWQKDNGGRGVDHSDVRDQSPDPSVTNDPVGIRALSRATADAAPIFVNYPASALRPRAGRASASLLLPATAAVPASTAATSR